MFRKEFKSKTPLRCIHGDSTSDEIEEKETTKGGTEKP